MAKEIISVSHKELDRLQIIRGAVSRHITQDQAAERKGLSVRQVKHLVQRYRVEGSQGMISPRRGKCSNNAFSPEFRSLVGELIQIDALRMTGWSTGSR